MQLFPNDRHPEWTPNRLISLNIQCWVKLHFILFHQSYWNWAHSWLLIALNVWKCNCDGILVFEIDTNWILIVCLVFVLRSIRNSVALETLSHISQINIQAIMMLRFSELDKNGWKLPSQLYDEWNIPISVGCTKLLSTRFSFQVLNNSQEVTLKHELYEAFRHTLPLIVCIEVYF